MQEYDLDIVFTPAMLGSKKKSQEVCSTNNISRWWRHSKTKIMSQFKQDMREWFIPEWQSNPYRYAEINFTILRTNNRRMDPDSLGPSTYKWTIDLLTEQGYIVDDDQCRVVLHPTELNCKGTIETSVRMQIKLFERIEMTVEELKQAASNLVAELENVGGENHVKAACGRVRMILGDLKNATPELRRNLKDLDKK